MCKELFSAKGIIYKITCLPNNKSYVGQTGKDSSFFDRYAIKRSIADKTQLELLSYLKKRCDNLSYTGKLATDLAEDFKVHAPDEFKISILAQSIENDDERDVMEIKFMKKYKCIEKGYNTVKKNFARKGRSNVVAFSLINLETMKKIRGTNITHFCKDLMKKESITNANMLEKMRQSFTNIPKIAQYDRLSRKSALNSREQIYPDARWHWTGCIKHLSYFGYTSSWWLENGVPEHMEIVPYEYNTGLGKITKPLLKVKDDFVQKHRTANINNSRARQRYHFSLDPAQDRERKDALRQEFTDKIMQTAILYAEELTEEFKYVLDAPFGPGGITSYLNKKIKRLK